MTLLLGCCATTFSIREPTQHFGPNGAYKSSIEIAVDQRQHVGKARQIGAEFFSIFKRTAPFVEADVEQFVRTVNSQTDERGEIAVFARSRRRQNLSAPFAVFPIQLADRGDLRLTQTTAHRSYP